MVTLYVPSRDLIQLDLGISKQNLYTFYWIAFTFNCFITRNERFSNIKAIESWFVNDVIYDPRLHILNREVVFIEANKSPQSIAFIISEFNVSLFIHQFKSFTDRIHFKLYTCIYN